MVFGNSPAPAPTRTVTNIAFEHGPSHIRSAATPKVQVDSLSLNSSSTGWTKTGSAESTGLQTWRPAVLTRTIVDLTWTAPGDDGNTGKASTYDIRYSLQPLNADNWMQATKILTALNPGLAGVTQTLRIMGLPAGQWYYFALKTADEIPNWSAMSNTMGDSASTVIAICGDVDGSGALSISDEIALVAFIFGSGPRPDPIQVADMDCSGYISVTDAVYFINFIFYDGKPPCCVQ